MTITPRRAHTQLTATAHVINTLARRLPTAIHNAHQAIQHPELEHDHPRAEQTGVRKNWISDPTGEQATGTITRETRILEDLEQQLETLKLTLALLTTFADRWAAELGERTRCHGGGTVDEWSDPGCTNWADTWIRSDGTEAVRGDGLCSTCRKRKERWERQTGAA